MHTPDQHPTPVQQPSQPPAALGAAAYMTAVRTLLDAIDADQRASIASMAKAITGYSHMLAEEGHYRAGGLAPVVPILAATARACPYPAALRHP